MVMGGVGWGGWASSGAQLSLHITGRRAGRQALLCFPKHPPDTPSTRKRARAPERRVGGGSDQVAPAQELDVRHRALRPAHHRQRLPGRAQVVQVGAVVGAAKGDGVGVGGRELDGADVGGGLDARHAGLLVHAPQPHRAVVGAAARAG